MIRNEPLKPEERDPIFPKMASTEMLMDRKKEQLKMAISFLDHALAYIDEDYFAWAVPRHYIQDAKKYLEKELK